MPADLYLDELSQRWEEEGFFARDEAGQLIRYVEKTQQDYKKEVKLRIDGEEVTVFKAEPKKDAQGNVIYVDAAGTTLPRATTIFDAAMKLWREQNEKRKQEGQPEKEVPPIPSMCHQEHLNPVGVCRVCAVAIGKPDRNDPKKINFQGKFLPACVHPVEEGMVVVTLAYSGAAEDEFTKQRKKVEEHVRVLLELLAGDHLRHNTDVAQLGNNLAKLVQLSRRLTDYMSRQEGDGERAGDELTELKALGSELTNFVNRHYGIDTAQTGDELADLLRLISSLTDLERLIGLYNDQLQPQLGRYSFHTASTSANGQHREKIDGSLIEKDFNPIDVTSKLIRVNHDSCILCDRCARACTDVKKNFVIARAGKGYDTHIGFDLGLTMGDSSCVECGECMLSCPTDALTFLDPVNSEWFVEQVGENGRGGKPGKSAVTPVEMEKNELLRTLPWRYRQWNQSSVVRWELKEGDVICRLGDYGSTAYILNSGRFGIWFPKFGKDGKLINGWDQGKPDVVNDNRDLILGEMMIISHHPRTATVRALSAGEVFEVRRNILYALQRNPGARRKLDRVYRERAIGNHIRQVPLFKELTDAERNTCVKILTRMSPQDSEIRPDASAQTATTESRESKSAKDKHRPVELFRIAPQQTIFRQGQPADCFYMIRIGHVKVTQTFGNIQRVITYLRPNEAFGEIACLGDVPEIKEEFQTNLVNLNLRTATCSALDDVELVRIDKEVFLEMLEEVPALKRKMIGIAKGHLKWQVDVEPSQRTPVSSILGDFADQGIFNAQRLLVLDLESCTRCDECTKACSNTHGDVTRLIREGLRFDKWLVASSCRSCTDPYCLVGCPVDAIHRLDPASSSKKAIKVEHYTGDPNLQRMEIQIEDNCIGCGLCAENCPYGNINMHGKEEKDSQTGKAILKYHATTCDLCGDNKNVGNKWQEVSCVYACPHDAAHRMTGEDLLKELDTLGEFFLWGGLYLALADGKFDDGDRRELGKVTTQKAIREATRRGVPKKKKCWEQFSDRANRHRHQLTPPEARRILDGLVTLACAIGTRNKPEYAALEELAKELGVALDSCKQLFARYDDSMSRRFDMAAVAGKS